jgi:hypothetical protein
MLTTPGARHPGVPVVNVTNAADAKTDFITAGHCGNVVGTWYADSGESSELATTGTSVFPGKPSVPASADRPSPPLLDSSVH